jgi:HEAT repeats
MKARWVLIPSVLVVLAVCTPIAEAGDPVLEVSVESGRLSVRAQEAPLSRVLEAIGSHAGFKVVLTGDLDTPVTETLIDVPVEEGLRSLTRWDSVVLIYGEASGEDETVRLTELWVVGAAGALPTRQLSGVRGGERQAGAPPSLSRPVAADRSEHRDAVARARDLLAEVREQGVPANVDLLRAVAKTDQSPLVRRAAIMALAREPGVLGVGELQQVATVDPSLPVRNAAIWALASIKSAEAGGALRVMLNDPDGAIRATAHSALAQWSKGSPDRQPARACPELDYGCRGDASESNGR